MMTNMKPKKKISIGKLTAVKIRKAIGLMPTKITPHKKFKTKVLKRTKRIDEEQ